MRQIGKELLLTFLLLSACSRAKATPTVSQEVLTPQSTPTLTTPESTLTPIPTPIRRSVDLPYPEVGLTYQKVTMGGLECSIVPPGGGMWRAALSLGSDPYHMADVDEIRLHPITNQGMQETIFFYPKTETFPQPRTFMWKHIHTGSLACRSISTLQP